MYEGIARFCNINETPIQLQTRQIALESQKKGRRWGKTKERRSLRGKRRRWGKEMKEVIEKLGFLEEEEEGEKETVEGKKWKK